MEDVDICKTCGFDKNAERGQHGLIVTDGSPTSIAHYIENRCEECGHQKDGSTIRKGLERACPSDSEIVEKVLNKLIQSQSTPLQRKELKFFYESHKPIMMITLMEAIAEARKEMEAENERLKAMCRGMERDKVEVFQALLKEKDKLAAVLKLMDAKIAEVEKIEGIDFIMNRSTGFVRAKPLLRELRGQIEKVM